MNVVDAKGIRGLWKQVNSWKCRSHSEEVLAHCILFVLAFFSMRCLLATTRKRQILRIGIWHPSADLCDDFNQEVKFMRTEAGA